MKKFNLDFIELERDSFEGFGRFAVVTLEEAKEIVAAKGYDDYPLGQWPWQVEKLIEDARSQKCEYLELVLEDGCPDHQEHCFFRAYDE